MLGRRTASSPHPRARMTGVVYLLYFVTAVLGEFLIRGLVVPGDAALTANHLLAHEGLFRAGIAVGLIAIGCYIVLTALLYDLFKPVNQSLSMLAAFFSLVGCAIQAFSSLFQLAPLVLLGGSPYLSVFKGEELRAWALLLLQLHKQAINIGLVFFAVYCLLIGLLILRSTFLPRLLGVLMALAGLGWLSFLSPPLAARLSPSIQILGILAEGALMLWLLVFGVNIPRWKEQAGAAEAIRRIQAGLE